MRHFRLIWRISLLVLFFIGLGGVPEDLNKWAQWLAWIHGKEIGTAELLGNTGRWIIFAGAVSLLLLSYDVPQRLWRRFRKPRLIFVIGEGQPWVQVQLGRWDIFEPIPTPGTLYTYRVALANLFKQTLSAVEVKLTAIEPQPANCYAIGGHLHFMHDNTVIENRKDIAPTKHRDYRDGIFIDICAFFLNNTGSSWLRVCSIVPGIESRIPVRDYRFTVTATSRHSDVAIAELDFVLKKDARPVLTLVGMQSSRGTSIDNNLHG